MSAGLPPEPDTIAHRVSRGAFYLAVEKVSGLLSGIVYFALLLRWLGPTKYGIMTLALSFAGLATMASGNFEVFLERYAAEYEAHGALRTLRRAHWLALGVKLVLGALAALAMVLLAPFLASKFAMPELAALLPLLALMVAFDGLSTTGRATLFGIQRFKIVSLLAIAFHAAKIVLVAALWSARQGLAPLAIGISVLAVAQGAASSAVPLWMLRRAEDHPDRAAPPGTRSVRALARAMTGYCLPLLGARISFLSGQNLGKIVLGKLFSTTQLGYFSFAFNTVERFVEVAYTLPSALLPSFTQLVARQQQERLRTVFDQALRLVQVGACGLSLTLVLFAREITVLVAGHLFEPAVPMLQVLALVPIARTAQQPLTMLFQAMRQTRTVLWLALVKFVTEFTWYFTVIPVIGPIGAAWANLAGAVVSHVAALVLAHRLLPGRPGARVRAVGRSVALTLPLIGLAVVLDHTLPGPQGRTLHELLDPRGLAGLAVRAVLVPLFLLGAFALGLVTREDVGRLASIPLRGGWMPRVRDALVAVAAWFARATPRSGAALPLLLALTAVSAHGLRACGGWS